MKWRGGAQGLFGRGRGVGVAGRRGEAPGAKKNLAPRNDCVIILSGFAKLLMQDVWKRVKSLR